DGDRTQQVLGILLQGLLDGAEGTDIDEALGAIRQLGDRGTPEATSVARQVLELVPRATGNQLQALSKVVAAVADKGDAEATRMAATALVRRALEFVPRAFAGCIVGGNVDVSTLEQLSMVVAAVAEKADPEIVRTAAAVLTRRVLELAPTADNDYRP